MGQWFRRLLYVIWRVVQYTILIVLMLFALQRSTLDLSSQWYKIAFQVSEHQFDYIAWEVSAIATKVDQTLFGMHPFMSEADRSQFVRDTITILARAQSLEAQINTIYVDPDVADPDAASADLRAERDSLRSVYRSRQAAVEAILEGQIAAVLVDAGFGVMGQLLPPISMHFSNVPNLLIVSPRDTIRFDVSLNLYPLSVDEKETIEDNLDRWYDVSSLIVPIGGIALYPAMILETASINWAIETFAHEWLHHYLYFFPLGIYYITGGEGLAGEARIINETTADVFGKAVSRMVLERYYPDLLPPPPPPPSDGAAEPLPVSTPDPNAFDFGATMNETRITVDELLAAGKVEEAEAYMALQRELFVANGYTIRKLNQAYFAFYGGYQGGDIPGVGGEDPIGPAVRSILENSPSIHDFVLTMQSITTRAQLLAARELLAGEE